MDKRGTFSEELEAQVRKDVRYILSNLPTTTKFIDGKWIVNIDVTDAENQLVKLALEMY